MGTVAHFVDLRAGVVDALRLLARSPAGQTVIRIGDDACEVEWSPDTRFHHALLLPLVALTTAIDEGAARARWRDIGFAQAVDTAPSCDLQEKAILRALAGAGPHPGSFARELLAWSDRFGLADVALTVDRDRLLAGAEDAHYGILPVVAFDELPARLKDLPQERAIAAVALLSLYNGGMIQSVFRGKRHAEANPPVTEGISILRERGGEEAFAHLLRMLAAYRGW